VKPLWEGRKVVVCVGTGGVGKTTAAASLGIAAAASGLRTLVMTIDPARRLANALGIADLGNVEREITAELLAIHGIVLEAPLWVMMPDVKRTFDQLIERTAPDDQSREKILGNRVYQHFSSALAGSHEYAAVEKLYEAYATGRYDLIVLDTPPSQNAVDFLQAPGRVLDFLETETLQWLLKPYVLSGKVSLKILDFGSSIMLRTLGRLAGGDTLRELAEFVFSLQGMYDGFRERSRRVKALLRSEENAFVLVTAPAPSQIRAMHQFRRELRAEGLRVQSVVVNRVREPPPTPEEQLVCFERLESALAPLGEDAVARTRVALEEELRLAAMDQQALHDLRARLGETELILLPELPLDVRDLNGLAELATILRRPQS
jgi:anion-transporting  ArsA/GET3 family ATPase